MDLQLHLVTLTRRFCHNVPVHFKLKYMKENKPYIAALNVKFAKRAALPRHIVKQPRNY